MNIRELLISKSDVILCLHVWILFKDFIAGKYWEEVCGISLLIFICLFCVYVYVCVCVCVCVRERERECISVQYSVCNFVYKARKRHLVGFIASMM